GVLGPSLRIVADEGRIEVQGFELPLPALLHVRVLVHALHPGPGAAVLPDHVELAAAGAGRQPVGRDIHDRLQLDVIVHAPEAEALRRSQAEELADVGPPDIHPGEAGLEGAVADEQVRDLIPAPAVDVVAVDALQVLDLLLVLQQQGAMRQLGEPLRGASRGVYGTLIDRRPDIGRGARAGIVVVEGSNAGGGKSVALHLALAIRRMRQLAPPRGTGARGLWGNPTGLIRCAETGVVVERVDLPHAVILLIADLVDALGPRRTAAVAAEHRQCAPASLGALAARIQVNDRLDLHVIVEPPIAEPDVAHLA